MEFLGREQPAPSPPQPPAGSGAEPPPLKSFLAFYRRQMASPETCWGLGWDGGTAPLSPLIRLCTWSTLRPVLTAWRCHLLNSTCEHHVYFDKGVHIAQVPARGTPVRFGSCAVNKPLRVTVLSRSISCARSPNFTRTRAHYNQHTALARSSDF